MSSRTASSPRCVLPAVMTFLPAAMATGAADAAGIFWSNLRFPVIHDLFRVRADVLDPLRIFLGLHAEQGHVVEDLAEEGLNFR